MRLGTVFKVNKAMKAQKNGDTQEALRLFDECFRDGVNDARNVLSYAVLLMRDGQFQKAKDLLVKHQKAPGMTPDQKVTLIVDYAACCFRLGEIDKGIGKLEELYRKNPNGLIYQTLGYLYVEQFDPARKEEFLRKAAEKAEKEAAEKAEREAERAARAAQAAQAGEAGDAAPAGEGEAKSEETGLTGGEGTASGAETAARAPEQGPTPEEQWEAGREKALAFNQEAVDYDEEDPIFLDNLGQTWYRVMENPAEAKPWFEKAIAQKPEQIDTLFFLSRYDLAEGKKAEALKKLEKAAEGRFSPLNCVSRDRIEAEICRLKEEA